MIRSRGRVDGASPLDAQSVPTGVTRRASVLGAVGVLAGMSALLAASPANAEPVSGGLYLLGDSWGAGLFADPARALGQVAARILGMSSQIDAVSGTGYVTAAGAETYLQRASTAIGSPRLAVVQGGSNDDGQDLAAVSAAARATYTTVAKRFPNASLLVLGPGPDPAPVTETQYAVDRVLRDAASGLRLPYISMLDEGWVPPSRVDAVIDPVTEHPTVSGQAYLGTRLAASIRLMYPTLVD